MADVQKAANFFDCKEDELKSFDEPDIFNPPHTIQGSLCRIGDHRYGSLYITSVDNIPCAPQVIWGTPKQSYPFDRNGRFNWPPCKKVNVYTKLDGTAICAYTYRAKKEMLVTYKTRLTPVVRANKFGDFANMWREMLAKYPAIPKQVLASGCNLSFELYGARNLHLIVYDVSLDTRLLFGTPRTAAPGIIDPRDLTINWSVPGTPPMVDGQSCTALNDLTSYYKKHQAEMEATNKSVEMGIKGDEGMVLYAHLVDGSVKQYKMKPESVEKIHWSHGGLGKNVIRVTCINAFENEEDVTVDFVKQLLREEFEPSKIDKQSLTIARILDEVKAEMKFRQRVVETYQEIGIRVEEDKRAAMRAMSEHFGKNVMGYVYWIVTHC